MKRGQVTHQSKISRARRGFWKRFGIWVFIVFFALSVAGGLIVIATSIR